MIYSLVFFFKPANSKHDLLSVSVLGVEFRDGGHKWLKDNLTSAEVHMIPFQVTKDSTLDCVLYKKKVQFPMKSKFTVVCGGQIPSSIMCECDRFLKVFFHF